MLAAVFAEGTTIIENAAREPHIVDMACFLNACGAKISGAGTSMIRIKGVEKLHGCTYELAPDMIEAGTYMVAAAATGGRICVRNVVPKHMESISAKLREIGIPLEITENSITVSGVPSFRGTEIRTNPYPGFPTDMHPQFSALLALSQGMSTVSEGIYSGRFKYVPELNKMGAHIEVVDNAALINGVEELHGAEVKATDLRAGACLVIAALAAHGVTTISGVECIDRGYENLVEKLKFLGANIKRT
jgi:UDP-N-acetylglucosamine 1-carboxyvinyltransferase